MARTRVTPRPPLPPNATPEENRRYFLRSKQYYYETLPQYLDRYYRMWIEAEQYGVSSTEALLQLVEYLPEEWQRWAWEQAEDPFWHSLAPEDAGASFRGFVQLLKDQHAEVGHPPIGPYRLGLSTANVFRAMLGLPPSQLPWVMGDEEEEIDEAVEDEPLEVVDDVGPVDISDGNRPYEPYDWEITLWRRHGALWDNLFGLGVRDAMEGASVEEPVVCECEDVFWRIYLGCLRTIS